MAGLKSFKIVEDDLSFDSGKKIVITDGDNEVAQALERCFTTDAGEWFLNGRHGLKYPKIRGKGVTDEAIQLAVIKAAIQDERVSEVVSIEIERDNLRRTVDIKFLCRLVSGAEISVPINFS